MAPKSSENLKQKSFKTKPSNKPLVIHDNSSDSSKHTSSQNPKEHQMDEAQSSPNSDSIIGLAQRSTSKRKRALSSLKGKGKVT